MLASVRAEIKQVTDEIVEIFGSGQGSVKATPPGLDLMEEISERYGVPVEEYSARMSKLLSSFRLSKASLDRLRSLILRRCDLSLTVAELKMADNPNLPNTRIGLIWSLTVPEVEAGLVREAILKSGVSSSKEKSRVTDLLQLLFDLSKEVQASHILRKRK